jgi:hypothetical protein
VLAGVLRPAPQRERRQRDCDRRGGIDETRNRTCDANRPTQLPPFVFAGERRNFSAENPNHAGSSDAVTQGEHRQHGADRGAGKTGDAFGR